MHQWQCYLPARLPILLPAHTKQDRGRLAHGSEGKGEAEAVVHLEWQQDGKMCMSRVEAAQRVLPLSKHINTQTACLAMQCMHAPNR